MQVVSFDIYFLGLKDPSSAGRTRFVHAMARLTGRDTEELKSLLGPSSEALFRALDRDRARLVVDALDEAGARVEIRPTSSPPVRNEMGTVATRECPACGFLSPVEDVECSRCGLVFAKWERESVQRMQREARLEEALAKAMVVREEWNQRAKNALERHPLDPAAAAPFEEALLRDEIPFLSLVSDEGPLLLTSRRLLSLRDGGLLTVPYELIADVDFGGGLVPRKNRVRMVLTFRSPLASASGPVKKLEWWLDKDSAFNREVVMDWAFARNFLCGGCGARELEHRFEGQSHHFRCMRCATDHEVDLREAVAIPIFQD